MAPFLSNSKKHWGHIHIKVYSFKSYNASDREILKSHKGAEPCANRTLMPNAQKALPNLR